ncbi:hypothetical protein CDAR_384531 [Caerostris darwini]|uniref:Uncharacterized protein n=1 Tax=Caerostris darwini TaxID=1538125 RepID=A0AAV4SJK3_9ARAC|nr:hypothetical protein CDAR_384531 [Caerostris darwini]
MHLKEESPTLSTTHLIVIGRTKSVTRIFNLTGAHLKSVSLLDTTCIYDGYCRVSWCNTLNESQALNSNLKTSLLIAKAHQKVKLSE